MKKFFQPFHLVSYSPWPIIMSFLVMDLLISVVYWFNYNNFYYFLFMMMLLMISSIQWWRDVIRESMNQGFHTFQVVKGIKLGMILFIISELMFFFSMFWCYFHMFLSPGVEVGGLWPPKNIIPFNPYGVPLLNTIILLSSGISITWCHYSIINYKKLSALISLLITLLLGMVFTLFQFKEYYYASFSFSDSVYGSIFFMLTGFHGFHVLVGSVFLLVNLIRLICHHFSNIHHLCFEAAAWYWHFVDVVWLFLYMLVYFWSF